MNMKEETVPMELLIVEYKENRSALSDLQKVGENWGKIMIPLSLAVLVLAVNVIETLPLIGIVLLIFLSISTIMIWRLIDYNAIYRANLIYHRILEIEHELGMKGYTEMIKRSYSFYRRSFIPHLSTRALLNIFAFVYMSVGIAVVIIKWMKF